MFPGPLVVVLTVVFVATGAYALLRLSALAGGRRIAADPLTELSHLLMSAAMIAMTWGWASAFGDSLQLVVFGALGVVFAVRALGGGATVRRRVELGAHGVMVAAMVWMVVSMSTLMSAASTPMGAMAADLGHVHHDLTGVPDWITTGNVTVIGALVGVVLIWVAHVRRPLPVAPPLDILLTRFGPWCHVLMATGMGVMLLAMT